MTILPLISFTCTFTWKTAVEISAKLDIDRPKSVLFIINRIYLSTIRDWPALIKID